jgi:hypothetical protein
MNKVDKNYLPQQSVQQPTNAIRFFIRTALKVTAVATAIIGLFMYLRSSPIHVVPYKEQPLDEITYKFPTTTINRNEREILKRDPKNLFELTPHEREITVSVQGTINNPPTEAPSCYEEFKTYEEQRLALQNSKHEHEVMRSSQPSASEPLLQETQVSASEPAKYSENTPISRPPQRPIWTTMKKYGERPT